MDVDVTVWRLDVRLKRGVITRGIESDSVALRHTLEYAAGTTNISILYVCKHLLCRTCICSDCGVIRVALIV